MKLGAKKQTQADPDPEMSAKPKIQNHILNFLWYGILIVIEFG